MSMKKECENMVNLINNKMDKNSKDDRITLITQSSVYYVNKGVAWYKEGQQKPCWYSASSFDKESFQTWGEVYGYLLGVWNAVNRVFVENEKEKKEIYSLRYDNTIL